MQQAQDHMLVEPNHVYVIPPNHKLNILNGYLYLLELSQPRVANFLIDNFFISLAQDHGPRAVGIILSGTGSDGTIGIRHIKDAGGMVMAQNRESAKYDGMPFNAIQSGFVDYILAPDKMPAQLLNHVQGIPNYINEQMVNTDTAMFASLQKIFLLLRTQTNHDFTLYKKTTICRRIERRMYVHQISDIESYVRMLQRSPPEIAILFAEFLIGVTKFFRDQLAFAALLNELLTNVLPDKPANSNLRIWVPGCSTGEEVYSIAIVMQEAMDILKNRFKVQIFGTDLDKTSVDKARIGIYPANIADDVNPERLQKFFIKVDSGYKINQTIREMVVFAVQNVVQDPPFTKLDLLSCRNLFIYFDAKLQNKLLPVFHYSLNPNGLLFLGSSETISQGPDLFTLQDQRWKLFIRKATAMTNQRLIDFPVAPSRRPPTTRRHVDPDRCIQGVDILQLLKTILQKSQLPPCVIINEYADIIYTHGRTGQFLELAEGEANLNILKMARPGLKSILIKAVFQASSNRHEIVIPNILMPDNLDKLNITLTIRPITELGKNSHGLMMVLFERVLPPADKTSVKKKRSPAAKIEETNKLEKIQKDLLYTQENLQISIESLEIANEELQSTNEELQSTNEELQSTNEELETSKEELQSLNEESSTVNCELQSRIDELCQANDDINNLLEATQIATVFLDSNLNIRRFTPKALNIIPLCPSDVGRPFSDFSNNLINVDLPQMARKVMRTLMYEDLFLHSKNGNIFRTRIIPYRTTPNVIDGIVISFDDYTIIKEVEARKLLLYQTNSQAVPSDKNTLLEAPTAADKKSLTKAKPT